MKLAAEMGVAIASPWVTWVKVGAEAGCLAAGGVYEGPRLCSLAGAAAAHLTPEVCSAAAGVLCVLPSQLRWAAPHPTPPSHYPPQASIVPAAAGLLLTPLLMYKLFAPEIKDTPEAPKVRWGVQ